MAKERGTTGNGNGNGNKNVDDIVASNKRIAESLKEISQQSNVFDEIAEKLSNLRDKLKEVSDSLSEQAQQSEYLKKMSASVDDASDSSKKFTSVLSQQAKQTQKVAEAFGFKKKGSGYANKENIFESLSNSSKTAKIAVLSLAIALKTLKAAGNLISGVFSTLLNVLTTLIDTLFTIGKVLFNFFEGLYEGLFEAAKEMRQLGIRYAREAEVVRGKFGNTTRGIGKAVLDMGNQIMSGTTAGLSGFDLFEDKVEALQRMSELAEAGGTAFELLIDQFKGQNLNNIYAFKEGLGLTNEQLAGLMSTSIATGKPVASTLNEISKFARGMAGQFGGSAQAFKAFARDITKARLDVKHFANVATPALAAAVSYAHKLGVEFEKVVGIMDAFDTFDSAAENVAKLSSAFGLNLDVMGLLKADTFADQLDMVKNAFAATGRAVENLNRHELKYLATTLQVDEATLRQALSSQNQGAALEDTKNAAKTLDEQVVTITQSLKDMTTEIKKFIREFKVESSGFFGTFIEGMKQGVMMHPAFMGMLTDFGAAIEKVRQAGMKLGKAFVEYFPGVKDILESLGSIMSKVGNLFQRWSSTITQFFKDLNDPNVGAAGFAGLWDRLTKDFDGFLKEAGPDGAKFGKGVQLFFGTITQIFEEAVAFMIRKAGELLEAGFNALADFFDPDKTQKAADKMLGDKNQGMFGKAAKRIKESPILKAWNEMVDRLSGPGARLWDNLGKSLKKWFWENKWEIAMVLGTIIAAALAIAIGEALIAALAAKALGIGGSIVGAIARAFPGLARFLTGAGGAGAAGLGAEAAGLGAQAATGATAAGAGLYTTSPKVASRLGIPVGGLAPGAEAAAGAGAAATGFGASFIGRGGIAGAIGRKFGPGVTKGLESMLERRLAIGQEGLVTKTLSKVLYGSKGIAGAEVATASLASKGVTIATQGLTKFGGKLAKFASSGPGLLASIGLMAAESYFDATGNYRLAAVADLAGGALGAAAVGGMVAGPIGAGVAAAGYGLYKVFDKTFREKLFEGKDKAKQEQEGTISKELSNFISAGEVKQIFDEIAIGYSPGADQAAQLTAAKKSKEFADKIFGTFSEINSELAAMLNTDIDAVRQEYGEKVLPVIRDVAINATALPKEALDTIIAQVQDKNLTMLKGMDDGVKKAYSDALQNTFESSRGIFHLSEVQLQQLMSEKEEDRQEVFKFIQFALDDDEKATAAINALTVKRLRDINAEADKGRQEQAEIAKKAADKRMVEEENESFLSSVGYGKETVKLNVKSAEERFKEIDKLYSRISGQGAVDLERKLSEMRQRLSTIDFTIIDPEKMPAVQDAFTGIRYVSGILVMLGGIGEDAKKAASSLQTLGSVEQAGSPAYNIVNSINNLAGIAERVTTLNIDNTVKNMTDSLTKLHEQVRTTLKNETANIKVTMGEIGGILGAKGTYKIDTAPLQVGIAVNVELKASDIEKMILTQKDSLIMEGFNEVGKALPTKTSYTYNKQEDEIKPTAAK